MFLDLPVSVWFVMIPGRQYILGVPFYQLESKDMYVTNRCGST